MAKDNASDAATRRAIRSRFQEQCFLIDNWWKLTEFDHKPADKSEDYHLHSNNKHHLSIDISNKLGSNQGLLGKVVSGSGLNQWFNVSTADLSLLVPKLRFFKYRYGNDGKLKEKREFLFDEFFPKEDLQQMLSDRKSRGGGIGLKNFSWKLEGGNFVEASRLMKANLSLTLSSLNEFLKVKNENNFLELILAKNNFRRNKSRGEFLKEKVVAEVGWADIPKPSSLSLTNKNFAEALKKSNKVLALHRINHSLNFNQDGSVDVDIEYTAGLEVSAESVNILDGALSKEIRERIKAINSWLEGARSVKGGADSYTAINTIVGSGFKEANIDPDDKEFIFGTLNLVKNRITKKQLEPYILKAEIRVEELKEGDRLNLYINFMEHLYKRRCPKIGKTEGEGDPCSMSIFSVGLAPEGVLESVIKKTSGWTKWTKKTTIETKSNKQGKDDKGQRALGKRKKSFQWGPEPLSAGDVDTFFTDISNALKRDTRSRRTGKGKVNNLNRLLSTASTRYKNKKGKFTYTIGFVHFGDIIDAAFELVRKLAEETKDPAAAYMYQTTRVITGTVPLPKLKKDGSIEYINVNISDIPISMNAFSDWFINKLVRGKTTVYRFKQFLEDAMNSLLLPSLGQKCFGKQLKDHTLKMSMSLLTLPTKTSNAGELQCVFSGIYGPYANHKEKGVHPKDLYREKRFEDDEFKVNIDSKSKNIINYLFIFAQKENFNIKIANRKEDIKRGIYHLDIGSDKGIVKEIAFKKTDHQFVQESTMEKGGSAIDQLARHYDVAIKMIGNPIFTPGMTIYINPSPLGIGSPSSAYGGKWYKRKGKKRTESPVPSIARILGLGGYYLVTTVENNVSAGEYETVVEARFTGFGDGLVRGNPKKSTGKKRNKK